MLTLATNCNHDHDHYASNWPSSSLCASESHSRALTGIQPRIHAWISLNSLLRCQGVGVLPKAREHKTMAPMDRMDLCNRAAWVWAGVSRWGRAVTLGGSFRVGAGAARGGWYRAVGSRDGPVVVRVRGVWAGGRGERRSVLRV